MRQRGQGYATEAVRDARERGMAVLAATVWVWVGCGMLTKEGITPELLHGHRLGKKEEDHQGMALFYGRGES